MAQIPDVASCQEKAVADKCCVFHRRSFVSNMRMTALVFVSLVGASLAFSEVGFAAGAKTYQVTGTVLEVTSTKVIVQKGTERWEVDVGPETKGSGGSFKAGDKITITYTMNATKIEGSGESGTGAPKKQ